jgi:two-component system sensor histidine kinase HydH
MGPPTVVGLVLLAACIAGAVYTNRIQRNLANVLSQNVASLQAAQDLEIRVRQLRFHNLLYFLEPTAERLTVIEQDQTGFEKALKNARAIASSEQTGYIQSIQDGYDRYRHELAQLRTEIAEKKAPLDLKQVTEVHPVRHVTDRCRELLEYNRAVVQRTADESRRATHRGNLAMLLLGLAGPIGGAALGYGVARGVSRAISRAEQLSAAGQLAAGVAHEVRNPLAGIKLLVESAIASENQKPLNLEDLRVIHGEVARLENTVQEFLDFARPPAPKLSRCDLRRVIADAAELVRTRARQTSVELALPADGKPVTVTADAGQLSTVLVNLFLNAIDAMPGGGRVEIALHHGNDAVTVFVCDNGPGIPADILPRLFTPFATSKPTGTGLGLSVSRRIVEEHGGELSGANRPGGGACFEVTLPFAEAGDAEAPAR